MSIVGWHMGNVNPPTETDWRILEAVPPGCVVFLPDEGIQPEHLRRLLDISPVFSHDHAALLHARHRVAAVHRPVQAGDGQVLAGSAAVSAPLAGVQRAEHAKVGAVGRLRRPVGRYAPL